MKEYIGTCKECQKSIYCLDGFLNGIVLKDGILCFECHEEESQEETS
ncbi:hypothetical protein [Alkalihalobacillus sp. AL-G]|nr:hypothetical protein [Alkalihalobacillus sp. AL-G]WLD94894.1 hypothetical protein MOJ78_08430 [Alkalihalobacillus sp. AL-G]